MKKAVLISVAALCFASNGVPQGHLRAGDSLVVGFTHVDSCQPCPECIAKQAFVDLYFGADILDSGESLRLEMFETDPTEAPLAVATWNGPRMWVGVGTTSAAWEDYQGMVRATMLSGEVDVNYADFVVIPGFLGCDAVVVVPEPSITMLAGLSVIVAAAVRLCGRGRKNKP